MAPDPLAQLAEALAHDSTVLHGEPADVDVSAAGPRGNDSELFTRYPAMVAHSSQLRAARDYLADDLAGIPVLSVRQEDQSVQAFLNVCRHRGVRVVAEIQGQRRSFTCPYHGWTYGPDGGLRGIPYRQAFTSINRDERSLRRLATEERHGFVWAQFTPDRLIDVMRYLGAELDAELTALRLETVTLNRSQAFQTHLPWNDYLARLLAAYKAAILPGKFRSAALGRHVRLAGLAAESTRTAPPARGDGMRNRLRLVYLVHPSTVLAWQGSHLEVTVVYPDATGAASSVGRTTLLVDKARAAESALWDEHWAAIVARMPSWTERTG